MSSRLSRAARIALASLLAALVLLTGGSTTASASSPERPAAAPTALTVEHLAAPVDLENLSSPLMGWQAGSSVQTAYQVQVATTANGVAGAGVWDSGKTGSAKNANVAYAGPALSPASGYYWRVRTWDGADVASDWSKVSHFGTGPGTSWAGASPIWTPGVASGWTDYTFEGTFTISGVAASINFRAKDSTNFYMWQFRASNAPADPSTLKAHANVNGSYTVLSTNQLPFALGTGTSYDFRIVVDGTNISTYLKASSDSSWVFVNSTDDSSFTAGGIGFRTGSTESASYDNLRVTDPTGTVLYGNDFSDAATTDFTCGTVTNGRLLIGTSKNCNYGVDWQNYTTEVTLKISSNTAAVSLKATSTTSFYLWQLKVGSPGTIVINKNGSGTYTALKTITLAKPVATGTDYKLKVVALGNTYKTYLDDTLVDTLTDATYTTGRVGFRAGGSEAFSASNLTVTPPDGQPFYANTFAAGNTDFSCGSISSSRLVVPNGASCVLSAPSNSWAFLRGDIDLDTGKEIRWAHLYAAGASTNPSRAFVYKLSVNGTFVGVGPTRPIGSETRYDGYDVTDLLKAGTQNSVGALAYTTSDQRFIAKLVVSYTDDSTSTLGTGSGWKALNGSSALPDAGSIGTSYYSAPKENVNAAQYPFGFDTADFDDATWKTPVVKAAFTSLVATPTAKVERQLRTPASVTEYSPGNYFIDYGRTWVGGVNLDVTGTAGQVLDIRYGEVTSAPNTVRYATAGGNNYQDLWTLKAGRQHLETWGMRVFRYAQVLGAPSGLGADDFKAMAYVYPYDPDAGVFDSSDPDLNKVWQLNKNTIEATNGNLYVDSWERERGAYEADSYLQMMSNFYTSSDPTLGNYSIAYLFKQRTWPTEWPIYIILAMHDSYAQTGDVAALKDKYSALQAKLPNNWFESSTGLIRKTSGSSGAGSCTDCDIVDWPTSERDGYKFTQYNTVINAISYRAYADMAEIATALGKTADARTYGDRASTIKAAVNAKMWDASKGAYRDGLASDQTPTDHWAVQASVFANAFGLTDDAQAAAVASYIGTRGMVCSVYCSAFLFESLYNGDRADVAYDLLTSTGKRSYLNMINAGAGATMEAWDLSLKSNTTYSHPWAASIAYNLPQGMFGIRPTTAGYDSFDIKPQADDVTWAHVTVPTSKGRIGAAYDTAGGRVDVGVFVPNNSRARVFVPGAPAGATSIYVDGASRPAVYDGGYYRVDDVQPGCHVFSPAAGLEAGENPRLTSICRGGYIPADTTAPQVTVAVDPADPDGAHDWFTSAPSVSVAATDARDDGPKTEVSIDGGAWKAYGGPVVLDDDGVHTVAARATDAAGNVSGTATVGVKVDRTKPVVTLANGPAGTVTYGQVPTAPTCLASDATSGLDACTVSGYSTAVGDHTLTATAKDRAGNDAIAQRDYTVAKADQTITLLAAGSATFGDPDVTISATATSGLPVAVTATGACTLSGTSLHLSGAGDCTLNASQEGDGSYNAAPDVETVLAIGRAHQTITFPTPKTPTFGDADLTLQAAASSGLPVTYAAAGACTVTEDVVHIIGAGGCTLTASQAGSSSYNPADDATVELTIAKAPQTLSLDPVDAKRYGDASFTTTATASSGLPVVVAADGACSIDNGTVVNLTGAGSCTISASQPGSTNYLPAPSTSQTFQIAKADQAVSIQTADGATFGDPNVQVSATATSGLPVTLVASGACTLTSASLTLAGAGECTITADQAGDANHNPAQATRSVSVGRASQSISLTAPSDKTFGDADFSVSARASSGLPVTLAASGACTAVGAKIHLVAAGTCTLIASQPGNGDVNPAEDATVTVSVAKASQTITFPSIPDKLFGDPSFTTTPTASSGLPVLVTAAGGCTIADETVRLVTAGTCTLTATQAGDGNHKPAPTLVRTFQVTPYTLRGFHQPVDTTAVNTAKAGSTVPVKFEVFRGATELTSLTEITSITYASIPGSPTAPTDEIEALTSGASGLRYDTSAGQYQYSWKTPSAAGSYRLTVKTKDGSKLVADFRLR